MMMSCPSIHWLFEKPGSATCPRPLWRGNCVVPHFFAAFSVRLIGCNGSAAGTVDVGDDPVPTIRGGRGDRSAWNVSSPRGTFASPVTLYAKRRSPWYVTLIISYPCWPYFPTQRPSRPNCGRQLRAAKAFSPCSLASSSRPSDLACLILNNSILYTISGSCFSASRSCSRISLSRSRRPVLIALISLCDSFCWSLRSSQRLSPCLTNLFELMVSRWILRRRSDDSSIGSRSVNSARRRKSPGRCLFKG
mmetsp:Transcript_52940/g.128408  ORF Transcript_52940/g.128408 Transcript_52940/m.128408 type:complete len:249 (+) Transcript_52940:433-1179(+)